MSNFKQKILNPYTNKIEEAEFLDNYFGRHLYGIKFSDKIYPEEEILTLIKNNENNRKRI